ncbi:protease-4 [Arachidicoccus rhizosphaerae]|uniref:Protease-4 n=1 Tax=Arachidicoccus rhizosphaerae TaxID=551991 RepID=A0A1H4CY66_9BACT|nr:signal peptide peptidase SppA [Arachidicoccus rhizosphaerae]SEA65321.1 protease-4 [Arachidicoccus rhizosphaerae]
MVKFLKLFVAVFISMLVCGFLLILIGVGIVSMASHKSEVSIKDRSVLVLDLSKEVKDFEQPSLSLSLNTSNLTYSPPNLYEVLSMIRYAGDDPHIKALYIKGSENTNGFAASQELRRAIEAFKKSGKKVIAFSPTMTQSAYFVSSAADKVYVSPEGGIDWSGMVAQTMYYKGLLDKLDIHPEIFYAGKFKSATEPFRRTDMSDANRQQTSIWLGEIYGQLLTGIAESRGLDPDSLHMLADEATIRTAHDALKYHMVDGLEYADQVEAELRKLTGTSTSEDLNLVSLDKYNKAADYKDYSGKDRIAVLYAQGDITSGSDKDGIQGEKYVSMIRDIRSDSSVKALVIRVNSPGGSALASDLIWREIQLTKKVKPVVISMGNMAASGGYYISCGADYIFAEPTTITGSIGVFSIMGDASGFLKNKLGITFDAVKTGPHADLGSIARPLTDVEKNWMQASVDSVYYSFTSRVAQGRDTSRAYIDSIGQGHVWTGLHAKQIGLVDAIGGLQDAIDYAAKQAHSISYRVSSYPVRQSILSQLLNSDENQKEDIDMKLKAAGISTELTDFIHQTRQLKAMMNEPQTRLPYELQVR